MRGKRTDVVEAIAQASRGVLTIKKMADAWPSIGEIRVHGMVMPARVYVGAVGDSHRGRPGERRFQNPGQGKPIETGDGELSLLLGVLETDDEKGPLVVAMDAYRRDGLETRFSMFMPASLFAGADRDGVAVHETQSAEVVYAFRAAKMEDYVTKILDVGDVVKAKRGEAKAEASIHIRPKVGMYAAFARLNYKPWFAIAEFVDNAVQSYLSHRKQLGTKPLEVEIRFDEDEIVVSDRAAGIALADFPRAFSPSQPPPDASGLSEFGLGMKAAACWFARSWSVRTSALGDPHERIVKFDVDRITSENIEHLPIHSKAADADAHYTVITMRDLRVKPHGRTLGKIKDHLESIYRVLTDKGLLQIRVTTMTGSSLLKYERPELLRAPYFKQPNGKAKLWKTEFEIALSARKRVWGWAGLLERGSGSHAGFSVFRRDRLIQGSGDETYRPLRIFRTPNSYTYQRLVGEIFVEGFDVSHTKDGIQWDGLEDQVLSDLHRSLSSTSTPILSQAEGYRVRQKGRDLPTQFGAEALEGTAAELQVEQTSKLFEPIELPKADEVAPLSTKRASAPAQIHRRFEIEVRENNERYLISLELAQDPTKDWYGYSFERVNDSHQLKVWINLAHPFSESYVNSDENTLGPLVRLVAAMVLAEHSALQAGVKRAGSIRQRVNLLLRERFGDERAR